MRLQRLPFAVISLFCVLTIVTTASSSPHSAPAAFGHQFGQGISSDMVCVRGECLSSAIALRDSATSVVSTYKRLQDQTFLGPVEITAPKFDFYNGELIRVKFTIDCEAPQSQANIDAAVTELKQSLNLPYEYRVEGRAEETYGVILWNDDGLKTTVFQHKERQGWDKPVVQIYEFTRMEQVRSAFNPYYTAQAWPPVAD